MSEDEIKPGRLLEAFREMYENALDQQPEILGSRFIDTPISLDPRTLGIAETTFEEMKGVALLIVRSSIYKKLGIDPAHKEHSWHRYYRSEAPLEASVPGPIDVTVYNTVIEGAYLHELVYKDGQTRWAIGTPNVNI